MRRMKRMSALGLLLCMALSLAACGADVRTKEAKSFADEGMTITLTEGFRKKNVNGYTVGYHSSGVGVLALREEFSSIENGASIALEDYAQLILKNNQNRVSVDKVEQSDGLTYMEYTAISNRREYGYFVAMFKSSDAFWLVQFFCKTSEYAEYRPWFVERAKTVTFSDA